MKPLFEKLLIANRGEIAVRIIRAARELDVATVAVFSDADAHSLAVQLADESVHIGPSPVSKSYLNINAILAAAAATGAQAVHPGYGFLAENAEFARRVEEARLIFVGPTPQAIRTMGEKAAARAAASRARVPVVPGSLGVVDDVESALACAQGLHYPVMIKASAGGGGRGIRLAHTDEQLRAEFAVAVAEARAAFGNGAVYLERFIHRARHIEVQVMGDGQRVVHCFERECSLQRRRQKLWEEAPSSAISPTIRAALCDAAVRLAESVAYRGAGTVEFLYDERTEEFFFIEMNTRIQVEHPVTEMTTGIDLVQEMIRIARGEPLGLVQRQISSRGVSIEVRINAEDPARGFMPGPGRVTEFAAPSGEGVRFDTLLFPGCTVPPHYDSLLGKLIVHDSDRDSAIRRLELALDQLIISGVKTTIPLFRSLCKDPDIRHGRFHTGFLETWLADQKGAMT